MQNENSPAPLPASSDEVRHQMTNVFKTFEPNLIAYHNYAEQIGALAIEYHKLRLMETWPDAVHEELTLAAQFDVRETPTSLDRALSQVGGIKPRKIIFDRVHSLYQIFI